MHRTPRAHARAPRPRSASRRAPVSFWNMLDAILCEFEGVLAETHALRRRALQQSFADEHLVLPDAVYAAHCAGPPSSYAVRNALAVLGEPDRDEAGVELLVLRAERHFAALAGAGVSLSPGARGFLEAAAGSVRLAIVTRMSRRTVEALLELAGLDGVFECLIAAEDTPLPKPAPHGYRKALARLARRRPLAREGVIALEDGAVGAAAAHAAGLRCITVGPGAAFTAAEATIPSLAGHSPSTLEALVEPREEIVR